MKTAIRLITVLEVLESIRESMVTLGETDAIAQIDELMTETPMYAVNAPSMPELHGAYVCQDMATEIYEGSMGKAKIEFIACKEIDHHYLVAGKLIPRDQPGMELAEEMASALDAFVTAIPM